MAVLGLLGLGFLLGIRHAFDADHVAAVSAVAADSSIKKSSLLGMFWGFGHAISLLIAGLAVLLLKITIPQKLALSFEFIVGIMLIALGINVLVTISKNRIHIHKHKHGNEAHIHFHSHKLIKRHQHTHLPIKKPLFIGMVHGLAGSAALTLVVLAAINSVFIGLIYILLFGAGSIIGMMLASSIISLPFKLVPNKLQKIHKLLQLSAGLVSIIIGLTILI
ncbi:sulfite exporter TauE/SafE family protein [Candidatus Woesearchaeota archaeon]|nr:sulfite exporter TauE/SafE family protein [Candidatus Woesearchaeota archaeon]